MQQLIRLKSSKTWSRNQTSQTIGSSKRLTGYIDSKHSALHQPNVLQTLWIKPHPLNIFSPSVDNTFQNDFEWTGQCLLPLSFRYWETFIYIITLNEKCKAQNFTWDKIIIMCEICIENFPYFLSWACIAFTILVFKKGFSISDYTYCSTQTKIMLVKQSISPIPFFHLYTSSLNCRLGP